MDLKKAYDEAKQSDLEERMDDDRDLINLSKYELADTDGNAVPNSISVTLNDIGVFVSNVEAALGNASEQVVCESEDKNVDTAYIEEFVRSAYTAANERLTKMGGFPLDAYIDQQMCRRGRGAARCLFRIENGELIPDLVPWDTRYVRPYGTIDQWIGYETTRSKDLIQAEYPDVTISGKEGKVLDLWGVDVNEVYIDGKKVKDQANPWKYVPACYQIVTLGSMLADKDSVKYQGESLLFLMRDLVPELNRLASIVQSLSLKALDAALQLPMDSNDTIGLPEYNDLTKPGSITEVRKPAVPVPYGEIRQSAYLFHTMVETRLQRAGLNNFDYGTFTQPMSAVALVQIGEGTYNMFFPRLAARGLLKKQIANMIIAQVIQSGQSVEVGTQGHKRKYDIGKLQGQYEIEYKYFITSPAVDAARYSIAASAGGDISLRTKHRDIYRLEDPDDEIRQLRFEEAERLSPAIKMHRIIKSLAEEDGDPLEAEIMEAELKAYLSSIGQTSNIKTEDKQESQPIMSIFGEGGKSSAKKAAEIEGTPEGES